MSAFLTGPRPRAFAHRGWHIGDLAGCENSLAAFRRAEQEGYRYLETDVHATADGRLVAFHDSRLDRVTDGAGAIAELSWDRVRGARIRGREPIPLLAELLEGCPRSFFNIDAKSDAAIGPLLDVLNASGVLDRVCVGSFSGARLRVLRQALPSGVASSLGPLEVARLAVGGTCAPGAAVAAQVPPRFRGVRVITGRFVAAAHRAGLEVHAWTIDDPAEMEGLLDLGVDGIMTDRPDLLREVLQRRGRWVG